METVSRQGRSFREGMVLGLTMAEIMLLLVFCLLMGVAGLFAHEREKLRQAEAELVTARRIAAGNEAVLAEIKTQPLLAEELRHRAGGANPPPIGAFWQKLVERYAAVEDLHKSGLTVDAARAEAEKYKDWKPVLDALAARQIAPKDAETVGRLIDAGRDAERAASAAAKAAATGRGEHDWPPIISLSEADGYYFRSGSAELTPAFEKQLKDFVVPRLVDMIKQYNVDVVEVIGHTDELPVARGGSNLDQDIVKVVKGQEAIGRLAPADNAGLGLARAVAVVQVLAADPRLAGITVLPFSAAQLIEPDGRLTAGDSVLDMENRRRIEIRVRRSAPASETGAPATPAKP